MDEPARKLPHILLTLQLIRIRVIRNHVTFEVMFVVAGVFAVLAGNALRFLTLEFLMAFQAL